MPLRRAARPAWVVVALVLVFSRAARAELPPIAYAATSECPTASAFLTAIRALPAIHAVTPPPRGVTARIVHEGTRFVGKLDVVDHDGATSTRAVAGGDCEDVAETLLFLTALALGLSTSDPPKLAPPAPAGPFAVPVSPRTKPIEARVRTLRTEPRAPSRRIGVHAGVDVMASSLVAPNVEGAIAPYVALDMTRASLWSPEVRLSFAHFASPTIGAAIGFATVHLDALALDACPIAILLSVLRARPCLGLQAGVIEGHGYGADVVDAHAETRPWFALAPSVRIEWTLFGRIELAAEVAAVIPLIEHSFYFGPSTPIENIPVVGVLAGLGVGARFR